MPVLKDERAKRGTRGSVLRYTEKECLNEANNGNGNHSYCFAFHKGPDMLFFKDGVFVKEKVRDAALLEWDFKFDL